MFSTKSPSYPFRFRDDKFLYDTSLVKKTHSALKNFFMTKKGEKLFLPDFGTGLHELIFSELNDSELTDKVEEMVSREIGIWFPKVKVENVEVSKEGHLVKISIQFRIKGIDSVLETLSLEIQNRNE